MKFIRRGAAVCGVVAAAAAAVGTATHFIGVDSSTATRIASFTPYLILLTVPALVLLLLARQRLAAVVCVVIAAAGVWSQLPLFVGSSHPRAPDDLSVRLMQANIRLGEADARSIVDTVVDERVDLLTVVELTPAAVGRLNDAGLSRTLPYSFVRPREGGGGAGIFSRFPLRDGALLDGYALHNIKAVAKLPGAAPTEVYALHPVPPYPEPSWKWVYELRRLHAEFAAQTRPLIVGADFNSTYDHRQFRDLLRDSAADGVGPLLDAQEYLGAGILATYPADRRFPALLAIDKILTRGPTPIAIRRVDLPGSDHHGLIGDIRVQRVGEPKER